MISVSRSVLRFGCRRNRGVEHRDVPLEPLDEAAEPAARPEDVNRERGRIPPAPRRPRAAGHPASSRGRDVLVEGVPAPSSFASSTWMRTHRDRTRASFCIPRSHACVRSASRIERADARRKVVLPPLAVQLGRALREHPAKPERDDLVSSALSPPGTCDFQGDSRIVRYALSRRLAADSTKARAAPRYSPGVQRGSQSIASA